MDRLTLKRLVVSEIDLHGSELTELSHRIHAHPEVGLKEFQASGWLGEFLEAHGFSLEQGICGMPTAFRARYGQSRPAIALLAEYDALPDLGHACGHNIIGTAAVGAAVAARKAVDALGGTVMVLGTPAEELHGGKAIMVEQGAFSDLDAAIMVHPGRRNVSTEQTLACISLEVEFFGREAHASAHPEGGINALEAMVLSFNGINALRQHIRRDARIHGIITDGGKAANIVPGHSAGTFLVRSADMAYLELLKGKVLNCFLGASLATGARLEYRWAERAFACLRTNRVLADLFAANLESLGRTVQPAEPGQGIGSTDMGNVSQALPAIHPSVAVAPMDVTLHSPEFARAAASPDGDRGLLDAAKAMAMTVVDLLSEPQALQRAWAEFGSPASVEQPPAEALCCS